MGLASDDLSLVIFRQPTESLQSFWNSAVNWNGFQKTLNFSWFWASHDWTDNLLRYRELDPFWIVVFVSVLLNCLKPPEKIVTSVLETQSNTETQSSTCHELWFACRCIVEPVKLSIALASVLLNWLQKQGHTPCMWENATLTDAVVMLVKWRSELQWSGDAILNCCGDAVLNYCGDVALDCCWDVTLKTRRDAALKTQRSC